MRIPLFPSVGPVLAALALAACAGDSTGSSRLHARTEFRYSGDFAGEFRARGLPVPGIELASFVAAQRTSNFEGAFFTLLARQKVGGGRLNQMGIGVRSPAVGTVTCSPGQANCPFIALLTLGADATNYLVEPDAALYSIGGTVTITSLTDERATGTFQLTLSDMESDEQQVQVTSGSFDVPLLVVREPS